MHIINILADAATDPNNGDILDRIAAMVAKARSLLLPLAVVICGLSILITWFVTHSLPKVIVSICVAGLIIFTLNHMMTISDTVGKTVVGNGVTTSTDNPTPQDTEPVPDNKGDNKNG